MGQHRCRNPNHMAQLQRHVLVNISVPEADLPAIANVPSCLHVGSGRNHRTGLARHSMFSPMAWLEPVDHFYPPSLVVLTTSAPNGKHLEVEWLAGEDWLDRRRQSIYKSASQRAHLIRPHRLGPPPHCPTPPTHAKPPLCLCASGPNLPCPTRAISGSRALSRTPTMRKVGKAEHGANLLWGAHEQCDMALPPSRRRRNNPLPTGVSCPATTQHGFPGYRG